MVVQRVSARGGALPSEWGPGGVESRIVAEVAVQLRMSPRFSDDGVPEGTCERPLSIHLDPPARSEPESDEQNEEELDVADEFIRAFRDPRV